jgi:hypothetical protein
VLTVTCNRTTSQLLLVAAYILVLPAQLLRDLGSSMNKRPKAGIGAFSARTSGSIFFRLQLQKGSTGVPWPMRSWMERGGLPCIVNKAGYRMLAPIQMASVPFSLRACFST